MVVPLAAIAASIQATILLSIAVAQFAKFEHGGPVGYEPGVLDHLGKMLRAPVFPFFRPEWTLWLRASVADERHIAPSCAARPLQANGVTMRIEMASNRLIVEMP